MSASPTSCGSNPQPGSASGNQNRGRELSPFFPGGVGDRHRAYLITFLGEALGGPSRYRGRDMATAHHGLRISDAHFDRVAGHLDATLDKLGVPRDLTDRIVGIAATLRPAVVTA